MSAMTPADQTRRCPSTPRFTREALRTGLGVSCQGNARTPRGVSPIIGEAASSSCLFLIQLLSVPNLVMASGAAALLGA